MGDWATTRRENKTPRTACRGERHSFHSVQPRVNAVATEGEEDSVGTKVQAPGCRAECHWRAGAARRTRPCLARPVRSRRCWRPPTRSGRRRPNLAGSAPRSVRATRAWEDGCLGPTAPSMGTALSRSSRCFSGAAMGRHPWERYREESSGNRTGGVGGRAETESRDEQLKRAEAIGQPPTGGAMRRWRRPPPHSFSSQVRLG